MTKNILITGATDGIGLHTTLKLAEKGTANLYLVGRNPDKTNALVERVRKEYPYIQVESFLADLSLPSQVATLAEEVKQRIPRLDVLLNNAGAFFAKKTTTGEGHEATFALNHLNYFLLTLKLLDVLKESPEPRIVNTASQAHVGVDLDFENLQGEKNYSGWKAYQMSKLENILFTYELADRLKNNSDYSEYSHITVNALHPGFVATKFGDNNSGFFKTTLGVLKSLFAINQDKGSETSFYLCTSEDVKGVSGKYFDKCREKNSTPQSKNSQTQKRLWEVSEDILKEYLP